MQIVIDIHKGYRELLKEGYTSDNIILALQDAVKNGIPLPEHHGRLIDADEYIEQNKVSRWLGQDIIDEYLGEISVDAFNEDTPTIIPATKEEKQIEKCCDTCKWDYRNFKEYADEATKLAHCRNCKQASGHEPMKAGKQTATKEGE